MTEWGKRPAVRSRSRRVRFEVFFAPKLIKHDSAKQKAVVLYDRCQGNLSPGSPPLKCATGVRRPARSRGIVPGGITWPRPLLLA